MMEAPEIAGLRQDGQRDDRPSTRKRLQPLEVGVARKKLLSTTIQMVALPIQLQISGKLQTEGLSGGQP
jgi:hypothetical protein